MRSTPNPYRDQSRGNLFAAANRRAGELMHPTGTRSPDERAALALDTAHLLLALGVHVSSGEFSPETPQRAVHTGGTALREAFAREYAKMMREARYIILMQAADVALGGGVTSWIATNRVGREVFEAGTASDEGLFAALEKLQTLHEAKRPKIK